jgi:DNA polymerase
VTNHTLYIDFETFWGTKYSLTTQGMSYTDFVCDERFQVHGAAIIIDDSTPRFLDNHELHNLFQIIEHGRAMGQRWKVVCHNMLFDGAIMYIHYGTVFDEYFCTLAMVDAIYQGAISSSLDSAMKTLLGWPSGKTDIIKEIKNIRTEDLTVEQWIDLKKYGMDDIRATHQLFTRYAPMLPVEEHQIMDHLLKMFCDPKLVFNGKTLLEACEEADAEREQMVESALSYGATEIILRGNKLFPEFLESLGYKVPMKENPKGELIPALAKTDEGFIRMLESSDERLAALAQGRLAVKSTQAQTRAYRFKKMHEDIGKFMVAYNYARAHTWRVTGGNKINAANLKRGSKLRLCIEAPEESVLGVADASQIECRSTGYLAGQDSLMRLFREKRDPYNDMATDIFGYPVDRKNNPDHFLEGFIGKTAVLGLGFGMGGEKFHAQTHKDAKQYLNVDDLDFPLAEANRVVYDVYRPKNYKIEEFWGVCEQMLVAMVCNRDFTWKYPDGELNVVGEENKIYFPNGTWLYYPGLDCDNGQYTYLNHNKGGGFYQKYIYGSLLTENIVQKFARDITSHHLVLISERYPVVMHTYDENVAVIPESEAEEGTQWMIELMEKPPAWAASLPLAAEGGFAKEYSK